MPSHHFINNGGERGIMLKEVLYALAALVFAFCLFLSAIHLPGYVVSIGKNEAYAEAVKKGFGEWRINEDGKIEFKWKWHSIEDMEAVPWKAK